MRESTVGIVESNPNLTYSLILTKGSMIGQNPSPNTPLIGGIKEFHTPNPSINIKYLYGEFVMILVSHIS